VLIPLSERYRKSKTYTISQCRIKEIFISRRMGIGEEGIISSLKIKEEYHIIISEQKVTPRSNKTINSERNRQKCTKTSSTNSADFKVNKKNSLYKTFFYKFFFSHLNKFELELLLFRLFDELKRF